MIKSFINASKNLLKKPQTIDYPKTPIKKDENYRGVIEYNQEECIYCLKCEKACPAGSILFVPVENPPENPKNKKGIKYHYNPYLCIYCTECVRACPKPSEALWQSNKKPLIGIEKDRVNEEWFEVEKMKEGDIEKKS